VRAKGKLKEPKKPDPSGGDDDMDARIDEVIKDIFAYYDPKNTGILKKDVLKKFFADSLELYALRKHLKSSKEVIAPNVKYDAAMSESIQKITQNEQGATQKEFEDFLNLYDLDEALGSFTGRSEVEVKADVKFVDSSQFVAASSAPQKIKYRDYSAVDNQ